MNVQVMVDAAARTWLESRERAEWVVAYDVHRCCGGGKICQVVIRPLKEDDDRSGYVESALPDGTRLLIDPRAARRMPRAFELTVRGIGPMKRLDLDLTGEQWGELLYT